MLCTIFFFFWSILRNVAKPHVLIWITLEADLWHYEASGRWFQEAPEGQKWEQGENIGCINQMITVRSPWINLTKNSGWCCWVTLKAAPPPHPRSENTELFSSKFCCHSLRAVSSDITDLALMAYLWGQESLCSETNLWAESCTCLA